MSNYLQDNILRQHQKFDIEYKIINIKTGQDTWVHGLGNLQFDDNNDPVEMFGTIQDITERKQAEEALKKSEVWMHNIFKSLHETVFVITPDRIFLDMNEAALKMFGYTKKELVNLSSEVVHVDHEHYLKFGKKLEEVIHKREPTDFQFEMRRKNGDIFPSNHTASLMVDNEGKPIGIISVIRDISNQKQIEKEKKKLETQLQQAQKMESIGTLAGGIAHDFNNILHAVIGYTELALDRVERNSQIYDHLQKVLQAGKRARDLVDQILTFSRQTELERKPVQIKQIINEVLNFLRASLPTTIEIHQNIQSDAWVLADPTQVHQILMNLCTNADHAMRKNGGVLEVKLEKVEFDTELKVSLPDMKPGAYLNLTVSDTGHGMPPDVLEKIFDPFFTTKETGEGTGLGLSVAHGIVGRYGGAITVDSEPGQGSTFKVYLPIIEMRKEPCAEAKESIPTGSERILFVDDEAVLVNLGKQVLESLGYDVDTRTDSIEALQLFKAQPDSFDLVITDLTMPNMTGEDLARELMNIKPSIPVILCTGFSAKIDERKASAMGIRAFVLKPMVKREIATTVRKVLDGK